MKKCFHFTVTLVFFFLHNADAQPRKKINRTGSVTIVFNNHIGNRPIVLYDSSYINPFGESYTISKLKYYISGIKLYASGKALVNKNQYYLINQNIDSSLSITFHLPENDYDSIGFLLGVDSATNTEGAQTGALDPVNDMFWTWRTGYVMEKLEGTSPQSGLVNNKMEYHIGGFSGENSVLNYITLPFPKQKKLHVSAATAGTIKIDADINKFWNGTAEIKIKNTPACTTPGLQAKQIAGNFCKLFTVKDVISNQ